MNSNLFTQNLSVVNIGVKPFLDAILDQGAEAVQIAWRPPIDKEAARCLAVLSSDIIREKIEKANQYAFDQMTNAEIHWTGMKRVFEVAPEMKKNYILHSGPPISWEEMCSVQKKGIIGGALHEGLAQTEEEAVKKIESGLIETYPAYDFNFIGAGAGIVTYSMVTNVCENIRTGQEGYCVPFEGRDGLAVWGVYNENVEMNLQEIENEFAPAVDRVLHEFGSINITNIIAQSLQMNDEIHTRQTAAGLLLVNEIVPKFLKSGMDPFIVEKCLKQFTSTERWFHPLGMAGAMAILRGMKEIPYCTIVTMNCSNGVENGIKVSGLGSKWITGKAPYFKGKYFSSKWSQADATPHIGDSTVLEMVGLGGFSCAASPNVVRLRGQSYTDAIAQSVEMREICFGINPNYQIPLLEFSGPATGVDIRKVIDTSITPICHGGIISKEGGQIGAGSARFPIEPYVEAIKDFHKRYIG